MHPRRRHGRRAVNFPDQPRARRRPGFAASRGGSGVDPRTGPVWRGAARGRRVASRRGRSRRSGGRGEAGSHRGRPRGYSRVSRGRGAAAAGGAAAPRRRRDYAATPPRPPLPPVPVVSSVEHAPLSVPGWVPRGRRGAAPRVARAGGTRVQRAIVRGACVSATPTPPGRMCADSEITTISYGRLYSPPLHSTRQIGSS